MFFRRVRVAEPSFEQRIENLKQWGFLVEPQPDGSVRVRRDGCVALVRRLADGKPAVERAGWRLGEETAVLADGGYQKFWLAPSGRRQPALAAELSALHDFEEDLREALGLVSLYNTSLGTVNALHLYDRLKGRADGAPL
jgi:hypothetical protein